MFLYADRLFKAGLLEGSNIAPLVAAITVGVCAGFLPHNFSPARIIMGDAGAMLLGLLPRDDDDHDRRTHDRSRSAARPTSTSLRCSSRS